MGERSVTDSYLYDSWGNMLLATGSTTNYFRYAGRVGYYFDADVGMYFAGARCYDSRTSRFLEARAKGHALALGRMFKMGVELGPPDCAVVAGEDAMHFGWAVCLKCAVVRRAHAMQSVRITKNKCVAS
jgi:RHS repeat-associated protein